MKMTGSYQRQPIAADCTKHQRASFLPSSSVSTPEADVDEKQEAVEGGVGGALGSLCENNILTAVLFQTNNIRDNQIKPSRRLPPDSQWRSLWLNLRVLQERTMALVVDRWGFKNKLLDVTSGGSRSDLVFLSICPSLPTVFPHHVRSRIHRSLHSDYR